MPYFCAKCNKDVTSEVIRGKVARADSCPSCGRDLHACINCKHYDTNAYNSCRESQAERQVDKEKSNFCDYFSYREQASAGSANAPKVDPLKALDDLFKK